MFWLKIVRDFVKILREGQTPRQVAGAFALGSIVGLSPVFTLQGLLVWLLILVLDVNLSAAILAFTLFGLVAFLADPLFHWLGFQILVRRASSDDEWELVISFFGEERDIGKVEHIKDVGETEFILE